MDVYSGGRVFLRDDVPTLLLYRRLATQYLMVVYQESCVYFCTATWAQVVRCVPCDSVELVRLSLPIGETLAATIDMWLFHCKLYLHATG